MNYLSSVCEDKNNWQRPQAAELKIPNAAGNCHAPQEYLEALQIIPIVLILKSHLSYVTSIKKKKIICDVN